MSTSSQADVYQIVYISGATQPIADRDLRVLANSFAQRNKQLHVTGLLLYHNKRFMQFLEGDIMIVGGLFEKIRNDPRHHSVFVMRRQYVLNRQFPDWTMRLAAPDEIGNVESELYKHLSYGGEPGASLDRLATESWAMLNAFRYS